MLLNHALDMPWTVQGFGLLRLHMGNHRLHLWDERLMVPGVSMIHDHAQWGLTSLVIKGSIINQRYEASGRDPHPTHHYVHIVGGHGRDSFQHEPRTVLLTPRHPELILTGMSYSQTPGEIHESKPEPGGTVTLMTKRPTDTDQAIVFWEIGSEWVSAQPRPATRDEVSAAVSRVLANWATTP
jgi:hypothetical protein